MGRARSYGQICPLAKAAELLCERWTLIVVRELMLGSSKFGELRRGIPLMSPTMLALRLRELEDNGIIAKRRGTGAATGPNSVSYALTEAGRELGPVLAGMSRWGHRWAVSELRDEDLEPSHIMWVAHRTLRTESLPQRRVVFAYELTDAPGKRRHWWIVVDEKRNAELCFKPPRFPIDVRVRTEMRVMAHLYLAQLSPREAIRRRSVQIDGAPELVRSFPSWCPRLDPPR